jgi:hypothetical protein
MLFLYNTNPIALCRYLSILTIRKGAKNPSDDTERPTCLYVNFLLILQTTLPRRKPGPRRPTASMLRPYVATQSGSLRRSSVSNIKGRVFLSEVVLGSDPKHNATSERQVGVFEGTDRSAQIYRYLHKQRMEQAISWKHCVGAAC